MTDDGDDSVIPLDDEEEYSRVKSLDDEFGDDAILVEWSMQKHGPVHWIG